MYKCLKEGWTTLHSFGIEHNLTRWGEIKLSNQLNNEFKCKIGNAICIFIKEAEKLI